MGADGLCCYWCGCGIDDLMPCFDGSCSICVPAKRDTPPEDEDCDEWYRPMTDEEIATKLQEDKDDEPEKPPQVATR